MSSVPQELDCFKVVPSCRAKDCSSKCCQGLLKGLSPPTVDSQLSHQLSQVQARHHYSLKGVSQSWNRQSRVLACAVGAVRSLLMHALLRQSVQDLESLRFLWVLRLRSPLRLRLRLSSFFPRLPAESDRLRWALAFLGLELEREGLLLFVCFLLGEADLELDPDLFLRDLPLPSYLPDPASPVHSRAKCPSCPHLKHPLGLSPLPLQAPRSPNPPRGASPSSRPLLGLANSTLMRLPRMVCPIMASSASWAAAEVVKVTKAKAKVSRGLRKTSVSSPYFWKASRTSDSCTSGERPLTQSLGSAGGSAWRRLLLLRLRLLLLLLDIDYYETKLLGI